MGPLGWQETIFIFVLALLVFGPKKLPQLGKDLAKVMGEFRRHTADLKGTWDRELAAMERETGVGEATRQIDRELTAASVDETYHGTSSSYDSGYDHGYGVDQSAALSASTTIGTDSMGTTEHMGTHPSADGATATQGAGTSVAELEPPSESAEPAGAPMVPDTIAREKPVNAHPDGKSQV